MTHAARRRFLVACSASAAASFASHLSSRAEEAGAGESTSEFLATGQAFGTTVSLTVRHRTPERARQAADAALRELTRVESLLTLYRDDSPLVQLNRVGWLDQPPLELFEVLAAARHFARLTHGAFDVTVQPLWELHAHARRGGRLPTELELAFARERVDWRRVHITRERIELARSDVRVTLNGIAQGYVADRVRRTLVDHGVHSALIDAGEINALGDRSALEPWRVGIQHPREADAYVAMAGLSGRSLATSGDYSTSFVADHSRHHVFNPSTGASPDQLASVSVVAPAATTADALSTAAMVLGPDRTARLLESLPDVDALMVTKHGRVLVTPGFPRV